MWELTFEANEKEKCIRTIRFENIGSATMKFWWIPKKIKPSVPYTRICKIESKFFYDKNISKCSFYSITFLFSDKGRNKDSGLGE